MRIFKNNAGASKEEIMSRVKHIPKNFSHTYDYLKRLVLENKNFDPD